REKATEKGELITWGKILNDTSKEDHRINFSGPYLDSKLGGLHRLHRRQPALPGFISGLFVSFILIVGVFTCAHKAVVGAGISDRIIFFPGLLHGVLRGRDGGADARIGLGIKSVDGSCDRSDILRRTTVEDERGP